MLLPLPPFAQKPVLARHGTRIPPSLPAMLVVLLPTTAAAANTTIHAIPYTILRQRRMPRRRESDVLVEKGKNRTITPPFLAFLETSRETFIR